MRKEELLESGILEAYVLDIATHAEKENLFEYMNDPDIQKELKEIEQQFFDWAKWHNIPPPYHLKSEIAGEIFSSPPENMPTPETRVINIGKWRYLAVAASVIAIISLAATSYLFIKSENLSSQLLALKSQHFNMQEKVNVLNVNNDQLKQVNQFFANGNVYTYDMICVSDKSASRGKVFWDRTSGEVMVQQCKLMELPKGMQYQVWAVINGKHVDLGLLPLDPEEKQILAKVRNVKVLEEFCITAEPIGGSEEPTVEYMAAIAKL